MTTLDASEHPTGPKGIGSSRSGDLTRRFVKRGDEAIIQRIRKGVGADISSHRPEDLKILDGTLTDRAREIVHRVQTLRKEAGLNVADRIPLEFAADEELASVLELDGRTPETEQGYLSTVEAAGDQLQRDGEPTAALRLVLFSSSYFLFPIPYFI